MVSVVLPVNINKLLAERYIIGFPAIYDSIEIDDSHDPSFKTDDNLTYFLATIPIHSLSDGFIKIIRDTLPGRNIKKVREKYTEGENHHWQGKEEKKFRGRFREKYTENNGFEPVKFF